MPDEVGARSGASVTSGCRGYGAALPIVRPTAYLNIVARLCELGGEADPVGRFVARA